MQELANVVDVKFGAFLESGVVFEELDDYVDTFFDGYGWEQSCSVD